VHAAVAILVIDLERAAVEAHAAGRAHSDNLIRDVHLGRIVLHLGLIDADIVFPGTDDGHVGAGYRSGAVIGAA
jgi:hypothetical protein